MDPVGLAVRLPETNADEILATIDAREGPSYEQQTKDVEVADGRTVPARVWINEHDHTYIGNKPLDERARMAITAIGEKGSASEYVFETRAALRSLGIEDPHVEAFADEVAALTD